MKKEKKSQIPWLLMVVVVEENDDDVNPDNDLSIHPAKRSILPAGLKGPGRYKKYRSPVLFTPHSFISKDDQWVRLEHTFVVTGLQRFRPT